MVTKYERGSGQERKRRDKSFKQHGDRLVTTKTRRQNLWLDIENDTLRPKWDALILLKVGDIPNKECTVGPKNQQDL